METPYVIKVALAGPLADLLEAKKKSDVKDYAYKHRILRSIMERYPDDFFIDSIDGSIAGISHRPTSFKIHMPIAQLPSQFRTTHATTRDK